MYTVAEALLTFASNLYTFVCSHSKHFGGLQLVSGKLHRELGQYGSLIESLYSALFLHVGASNLEAGKNYGKRSGYCVLQCIRNFPV